MGRMFIVLGVIFLVVGVWISLGWKVPFRLGRLPGDIYLSRGNGTFYFPIVTCVLLSVVLTLISWMVRR
jgi:hypothetical protein